MPHARNFKRSLRNPHLHCPGWPILANRGSQADPMAISKGFVSKCGGSKTCGFCVGVNKNSQKGTLQKTQTRIYTIKGTGTTEGRAYAWEGERKNGLSGAELHTSSAFHKALEDFHRTVPSGQLMSLGTVDKQFISTMHQLFLKDSVKIHWLSTSMTGNGLLEVECQKLYGLVFLKLNCCWGHEGR